MLTRIFAIFLISFLFYTVCTPPETYNPGDPSNEEGIITALLTPHDNTTTTPPPLIPPANNILKTFLTATTVDGGFALGGNAPVIADGICNSDPNKPDSNTYKAMITTTSGRYFIDGINYLSGLDWVFKANTDYYQADGTTYIGTTNANGFFNVGYTLGNTLCGAGPGQKAWSGLMYGSTTPSSIYIINTTAYNCTDWTDNTSIFGYTVKDLGSLVVDSTMFGDWDTGSASMDGCSLTFPLCCVQQ